MKCKVCDGTATHLLIEEFEGEYSSHPYCDFHHELFGGLRRALDNFTGCHHVVGERSLVGVETKNEKM